MLTFTSEDLTRCVDVGTTEDETVEDPEIFSGILSGNLPRLTINPEQATVTITDDDGEPL